MWNTVRLGLFVGLLGSGCVSVVGGSHPASQIVHAKQGGPGSACELACQHRASCGVGADTAACVADCQLISSAASAPTLAAYTTANCAVVTAAEPEFQRTVGCTRACGHRAQCVAGATDVGGCSAACAMLQYPAAALAEYTAADCDVVNERETGFQQGVMCLQGCARLAQCAVTRDFNGCTKGCVQAVGAGTLATNVVMQIAGAPCPSLQRLAGQFGGGSARAVSSGGGTGTHCTGGRGGCSGFNICCNTAHGTPAGTGTAGTCLTAPTCAMGSIRVP